MGSNPTSSSILLPGYFSGRIAGWYLADASSILAPGSRSFNGGCGVMVSTTLCERVSVGSNPIIYPNLDVTN